MSQFPADFKWGVATAAYQIEGGATDDGRGPSIWDTFSHTPGKVMDGDTGDIACDHYHRWQEDIHLMQQLGVKSYRLSISWSRVLPQGVGAVNEAGLQFYDQLVDGLLQASITPMITLYHWDLPQALEDQGGWANRDIVEAFANYANVIVSRLGDRVKQWITLNEPWVYTFAGYGTGRHAPGLKDTGLALKAVHHTLLAHGRAVPIIREKCANSEVGITLNLYPFHPATDTLADKLAAHLHESQVNRLFLDPVFGHGYPQEMLSYYGDLMPDIAPTDLNEIAAPLDFLGVNYYFPMFSALTNAQENSAGFRQITAQELAASGRKLTDMGWPMDADGLVSLLLQVQKDYAPKAMYITENGAAFPDRVAQAQIPTIDDPERVEYLHDHIKACLTAIEQGVPLKGYYLWSLLDNFEWAWGYSKRFGIVAINPDSLNRIPKQSYYYYQRVIAERSPAAIG